MLQIDQVLQNRYRIVRVLGQGGMGAVYQAQDLSLDVVCVVKEMLPPPDPAMVKNMALQFQREGKILATLRHMSLPRVSNYFVELDNYYLVMDLIEGRSLEKLIGESGLFEPVVLTYADQLLDVLGYIHAKGILHRDIKPANIIVQPDGRAVLVDFGLVKVLTVGGQAQATKTLVSALTPQYAPPEQYTGKTDQRSDLYSLAATLYQALAGMPPASATDQMSGIKLQPLRQMPHLQQTISANTETVLMKALALDRNLRYPDAASMRAELSGGAKPQQPVPPLADTSGATQVWSPDPVSEPQPPTHAMTDAPSQPAGGIVTPVAPAQPVSNTPQPAVSVPVPIPAPVNASPSATGLPAKSSGTNRKALLIGGIVTLVLVIGCCVLFGLPRVRQLLSGASNAETPSITATPIPLDATDKPGVKETATATVSRSRTTATTSSETETPEAEATAEPTSESSTSTGIGDTAFAEIDMIATDVAGTPQAADERYLVLAPGIELPLARIPAGEFMMGSTNADKDAAREEYPQHSVKLDDYWIGVDDITVEEFAVFVKATGYKTTAETLGTGLGFNNTSALVQVKGATWQQPGGPGVNVSIDLDYPVVQVSWDDANAFCQWASKVSGRKVRLPSEAQWEKAARGTDGRLYPWGNTPPDYTLLNYDNNVGEVEPIGSYSTDGDSPFGVADMAGNVWQWTSSLSMPYPYVANDGREDASNRDNRILRGGAFLSGFITSPKNSVRSAARGVADPTYRNGFISFRVVVAP